VGWANAWQARCGNSRIKDNGRPITAVEGIGRNLVRAIDGVMFYAVGIVTMLISRQNRRHVAHRRLNRLAKLFVLDARRCARMAAVVSYREFDQE
jgi:hypothetical protein